MSIACSLIIFPLPQEITEFPIVFNCKHTDKMSQFHQCFLSTFFSYVNEPKQIWIFFNPEGVQLKSHGGTNFYKVEGSKLK
jgi:hypothetical protein